MKPINILNTLKEDSWEDKCKYIFNKYRTEFDTINEVRDISDYLNKLYIEGGMSAVDDWFLSGASAEYRKDFKSLINTNLKESNNPELDRVLNEIKDEMKNQDTGTYDITSNDENEMYKFIDKAVKPIIEKSSLDDSLKKEIVGWMEADIRDNKRWSIKTGVKAIMDWYKVK